ncbi:MAG: hypothetical protein AAB465_00770 [Patescibacteria group bacterium]
MDKNKFAETNKESNIFDPVLELENIKQITNHTERRQKFQEYKAKLTEQKERIALMQDLLISFIRQNPDVPLEELSQKLEKMGANLNLADWQIEIGRKILTEYDRRHSLIQELKKQYPDERELFYFLFGWKPEGKIEVIDGPITLTIICHEFNDFIRLCSTGGEYGSAVGLSEDDVKKFGKFYGYHLGRLEEPYSELVNIVNKSKSGLSPDQEENIVVHEEQHAIYNLFSEFSIKELYCLSLDKKLSSEENLNRIETFLYGNLLFSEDDATDEILAYLKKVGQKKPKNVFKILTEPEETGGGYDFCGRKARQDIIESCCDEIKEKLGEEKLKGLKPEIEKMVEKIFVTEYQKHIQDGIKSFMLLKDLNFSDEETIAFLSIELLSRWPKVVNRLIEQRQLKGKLE